MNLVDSFFYDKISAVAERSVTIRTKDYPRVAVFSDCHRGNGTWNDSFLSNKTIYQAALSHYYREGFAYVELGDGDELWENRSFRDITEVHGDIFQLLKKFELEGRLFMVYGNHDIQKRSADVDKHSDKAHGLRLSRKYVKHDTPSLIPFNRCYESLCLKCSAAHSSPIYMLHGHQADLMNSVLWPVARWLVRYIWGPLELSGIKDPTSAARNYSKRRTIESRLEHWARAKKAHLIAGHTHRPTIPPADGLFGYYNSGSCIHPGTVTCIEIEYNQISLVKWATCSDEKMSVHVCKTVLGGPRLIK